MRKLFLLYLASMIVISIMGLGSFTALFADDDDDDEKTGVQFSLGYKQHYIWWDPVWKKNHEWNAGTSAISPLPVKYNYSQSVSNFMYNLIFSLRFDERWSLSGSFIYGRFGGQSTNAITAINASLLGGNGLGIIIQRNRIYYIDKLDADLLANCTLNKWMKVFFGIKYQGYILKETHRGTLPMGSVVYPTIGKYDSEFNSFGVGVGLGFTIPLVEGLYLLPNVSFLGMIGKDFTVTTSTMGENISKSVGIIGDLSLAYYIAKIRTTIAVGARAQYLYYIDPPRLYFKNKGDFFFGPSLSIVYNF